MGTVGLVAAFVAFCVLTWIAGIWLTRTTDRIDSRYNLGSAFGGLLILGITTSLPEIAIAVSAALQKHYDIIIGTLIGGVAIQTAIMSILDVAMPGHAKQRRPLTFAAASLTLVMEGALVVLVIVASILAIHTPVVVTRSGLSLASVLIVALWVAGLWFVHQSRNGEGLPWKAEALAAVPGRSHKERRAALSKRVTTSNSMSRVWLLFVVAVIATLAAGVGIQATGNRLAETYHISGGLFAATFIAFAGALPNISTGIASVRLGDYQLAISDIFGGNAFMPALFVVCDLITGNAVLRNATSSDIWFAALGAFLTTVYLFGLIIRPPRTVLAMGADSFIVVCLYIAGVTALVLSGGI